MTKKKTIGKEEIIAHYMEAVLTNAESPKSVFSFAREHGFEESKFYEFFASFEDLDRSIFAHFCSTTLTMLEDSEEYADYGARERLLAYYYTFFELLTANRSYVMLRLGKDSGRLDKLKVLSKLKDCFRVFINTLEISRIDFKNERVQKLQQRGISEAAWAQLLITLKFWMEDDSSGFEKTDVFIEKSVKAGFDLVDATPAKSVFDLAKFLWKEKATM